MLRTVMLILGLAIAGSGGVILYRALFIEPSTTAVINESTGAMREYPNLWRVAGGSIMLIIGACTAFFATRRKPM